MLRSYRWFQPAIAVLGVSVVRTPVGSVVISLLDSAAIMSYKSPDLNPGLSSQRLLYLSHLFTRVLHSPIMGNQYRDWLAFPHCKA